MLLGELTPVPPEQHDGITEYAHIFYAIVSKIASLRAPGSNKHLLSKGPRFSSADGDSHQNQLGLRFYITQGSHVSKFSFAVHIS